MSILSRLMRRIKEFFDMRAEIEEIYVMARRSAHINEQLLDGLHEEIRASAGLRDQLKAANTRAAKNGALALLAFGLIAIECEAFGLWFTR